MAAKKPADQPVTPRRYIRRILVVGLHGKFEYELPISSTQARDPAAVDDDLAAVTSDRLTLLYGVNGTGKTSVLRLLFHALSPAPNRGHRAALRQTQFREFKVTLSDSSVVRYVRDDTDENGYTGEVRIGRGDPIVCSFWRESTPARRRRMLPPAQLSLAGSIEEEEQYRYYVQAGKPIRGGLADEEIAFAQALVSLGINPVFLEDSRIITSDVIDQEESRVPTRERRPDPDEELRKRRELDVAEALELVRNYLSQLMFSGTQAGSIRVDNVYHDVAAAIIAAPPRRGRPGKTALPRLCNRVNELAVRARSYQEYGLLPESPMNDLADLLGKAEDKHGSILTQVLTPHLDGFEARLDALGPGLEAVSAFVDAINSFLIGKKVSFRPGRIGITLTDIKSKQRLSPEALSSGEKQIVLLFSDIISLQYETRLFLIDEPELSLNPDWQRNLMPSLLNLTAPSGMQVIAATHSIEIMARYRDRRVPLAE